MLRRRFAFGIDIIVEPSGPLIAHILPMLASPIDEMLRFVFAAPASCASRISLVEVGSGGLAPDIVTVSCTAQSVMNAGDIATCKASLPSDIDLSCGFHA